MKYAVTINSFDGGLNTKVSSLQGKPNESPDLQNVVFDDLGAVSTRNGYTKINTAAIAGAPDLLHSYRNNDGEPELLAVYGSIYKLSNTSTFSVISNSTGIFSAGVRVYGANIDNKAYLSNGTAKYSYNGTDIYQWGVPVPTTAVMTSIVSGNSDLAGSDQNLEYYYRVAYINNANVESPATDAKTFVVSSTCNAVNIYFDDVVASAGVAYRAVYRNDYLLDVAAVSESYVVDTHDTLIQERDQNIVDSRPPDIKFFLQHNGYVFGVEDKSTDLYYSDINAPESWDPTNLIRVGNGDGFAIRAIAVYNDGIVICKEDGDGDGKIFVLYMPDAMPDNWSLQELDLSYGGISPTAITRFGTFLMVLNRNGVYDLSTVQMGVVTSDAISYPIEPNIKALSYAFLTNAVSVSYKNKLWISAPVSSTTNNIIYQYDYVRGRNDTSFGSWSKFSNMSFKDLCVHDGELYSSDYLGYVYKLETGYNDNAGAINSYYRTMHIHGLEEHKENTKVWRYIYITVQLYGDWNLNVSWRGNYSSADDGNIDINLDGGGPIWGTAIWGIDEWGLESNQKMVKIPIHVVSKSIQLKFSTNTADEYFKVYNVALHYSLRGAR